jgi:hypothetical protein
MNKMENFGGIESDNLGDVGSKNFGGVGSKNFGVPEVDLFRTLDDRSFKIWMADEDICSKFLSALLQSPIEVTDVVAGTERVAFRTGSKKSILDITAKSGKYYLFNIESQKSDLVNYVDRCIFYACGLMAGEGLLSGEDYDKLKHITIIFINIHNRKSRKFVDTFSFRAEDGFLFSDKLNIVEINLNKFGGDVAVFEELKVFSLYCIYGYSIEVFKSMCKAHGCSDDVAGLIDDLCLRSDIIFDRYAKEFIGRKYTDEAEIDKEVVKMFLDGIKFSEKSIKEFEARGEARGVVMGRLISAKSLLDTGMDPKVVATSLELDESVVLRIGLGESLDQILDEVPAGS